MNKGIKGLSIIAISRGEKYSPNHIDNDAAIFNLVIEHLQEKGCNVKTYTETEFTASGITGDIIYDMARDKQTLDRLKELENKGALVINSAYGIENCIRKPMIELLIANGIPHPDSLIIATDQPYPGKFFPCWFKRADSHAIVKEDVAYASTPQEAAAILEDFHNRGIKEAVVNQHIQGDLVKFYSVQDSDFFYWFYPDPCSHSKFGLEKINGIAKGYSFQLEELKAWCNKASHQLNVPIYGGDCVILPSGKMVIIDFNDSPSFVRCRDEAGFHIAEYIYKQIIKRTNNE